MSVSVLAALDRCCDAVAGEAAWWDAWDAACPEGLAAAGSALAAVVLAVHGREHVGSAAWCEHEMCRRADVVEECRYWPTCAELLAE